MLILSLRTSSNSAWAFEFELKPAQSNAHMFIKEVQASTYTARGTLLLFKEKMLICHPWILKHARPQACSTSSMLKLKHALPQACSITSLPWAWLHCFIWHCVLKIRHCEALKYSWIVACRLVWLVIPWADELKPARFWLVGSSQSSARSSLEISDGTLEICDGKEMFG